MVMVRIGEWVFFQVDSIAFDQLGD
jgi:hypothetical protein